MKDAELFAYKGYYGSISVSQEDKCLHGHIEFITDLITYEGDTVPELKKAFEEAVDDYLATCQAVGKEPLKSCSGTFNVRIGPALHMAALIAAKQADTSLNDFVKLAISDRTAQLAPSATPRRNTYCAAESGGTAVQAPSPSKSNRRRKKTGRLYPAGSR